MSKETVVKEVIEILSTSNYIDTSEDIYNGLKQIKREITLNTVHDFLWALESSTVIDVDGKVSECSEKIKSLLEYMNNERYNQIIDEAYENYCKNADEGTFSGKWLKSEESFDGFFINEEYFLYTREEFLNKCKTDNEFSEKWGLKIEERELDMMERWQLADLTPNMTEFDYCNKLCDEHSVPTKLITITYNDIKIDIYE